MSLSRRRCARTKKGKTRRQEDETARKQRREKLNRSLPPPPQLLELRDLWPHQVTVPEEVDQSLLRGHGSWRPMTLITAMAHSGLLRRIQQSMTCTTTEIIVIGRTSSISSLPLETTAGDDGSRGGFCEITSFHFLYSHLWLFLTLRKGLKGNVYVRFHCWAFFHPNRIDESVEEFGRSEPCGRGSLFTIHSSFCDIS